MSVVRFRPHKRSTGTHEEWFGGGLSMTHAYSYSAQKSELRHRARIQLAQRIFALADEKLKPRDAEFLRRWAHSTNDYTFGHRLTGSRNVQTSITRRLARIIRILRRLIEDDIECQLILGTGMTGISFNGNWDNGQFGGLSGPTANDQYEGSSVD